MRALRRDQLKPITTKKRPLKIMILLSFIAFFGLVSLALHMAMQPANKQFPVSSLEKKVFQNKEQHFFLGQELKVVTYNIGYAFGLENNQGGILSKKEVLHNLENIVNTLKQVNADIIFLQEVDFNAQRTYGINQLEWIQSQLKLPYAARTTTWNKHYVPWPFWPPHKHFGKLISGQAILSRLPLSNHSIHRFNKPSNNAFWYNWFYLDRVVQKVVVTINNQNYLLFHVHLEAFDKSARKKQIEWLASSVKGNKNKSLLIAGDFNTENLSVFSQTTTFNTSLNKTSYTFPSSHAVNKLDYIFYSEQLTLKNAHIISTTASDHLPIIATFFIK
jgi:endonuclease/exonuclease/phosphatase family metal-dependent hydrolase